MSPSGTLNAIRIHTDVTIPYDELGSIVSVDAEGNEYPVIENGLFVLEGTEELNAPLSFSSGT